MTTPRPPRLVLPSWARQVSLHLVLAVGAGLMLLPFAEMLLTAFTREDHIFRDSSRLSALTLDNFRTALDKVPWIHYYRNTLIVVGVTFLGQLVLCLPAGYVLARYSFRGHRAVSLLVLVGILVPTQVTAIPTFLALSKAGLIDTLPALILPYLGSSFTIFLYRQFIRSIPTSIFDSARMDGARTVGILWHIVVPAVRPAIAAAAVFSIVYHWNNLFWPSVVVRTDRAATVAYGVAAFSGGDDATQYGPLMAAACMTVIPLAVAFCFIQRHFVRGVAAAVHH